MCVEQITMQMLCSEMSSCLFLNQAWVTAGHTPDFLKSFLFMHLYVCLCVCVSAPEDINNQWRDMA